MRIKDSDFYKSVYCGVCRAMKKETGALSCAFLSYDAVFLALARLAVTGESYTVVREKCLRHPFRKRAVMRESASLSFAAKASAALLYGKLRDDITDEKGKKRAAAKAVAPYAKKFSRRADFPEADDIMADRLAALATAEKENASPDACADISGEMLAGVAAFGLEGEKYAIMREIAFHIGRWIYLADAVCDYPDDVKRGRFNPFAAEYTAEEMKKFAEEEAYELTVPDLAAAQNAFALADCRDAHINACIENILHYGMKNSFYITMRKEWHDERSL